MSTSAALICRVNNKAQAITVHWDGYPEHVGRLLKNHYNEPKKIEALFALGDCSSLGPNLEGSENHSFLKPERGVSVFYHRDRKDALNHCKAQTFQSYSKAVEHMTGNVSYIYIFRNGKWSCTTGQGSKVKIS